MGKKFTIEYVRQRVQDISDCELLETEYKDNRQKMRFRCRCGEEFVTTFNHFQEQNRRQCTACAKLAQYADKRLTMDDLKARIAKFGCEYISGEYQNQKSVIRILCKCGHERDLRINSLSNARFPFSGLCEACSKKESARKQSFTVTEIAVMAKAFNLELLSDEYRKNSDTLRFRCQCGREFSARWNSVAQAGQTRCWLCSKKVSKGEYAIANWLDEHGVSYIPQKRFLDCGGRHPYPFDFFLPDDNICIEFDGEQHTRAAAFMGGEDALAERQARDAAKNAYCAAHDLLLLRIPYTDFGRIPEILSSMVIPR